MKGEPCIIGVTDGGTLIVPLPHAQVLPTSSLVKYIEPVPLNPDGTPVNDPGHAAQTELKELTTSLADTQVGGGEVLACCMLHVTLLSGLEHR